MAYKQKPGRGDGPKTGAGVESITSSIQGTNPFSEAVAKSKNGFGKITAQKVGDAFKDEMAYRNASIEEKASFDMASKSNSLVGGTLKDAQASYSFGKGSAKASESSAETMILKQNENQLPGGKGFKGSKGEQNLTIYPNTKPNNNKGAVTESGTSSDAINNAKSYSISNTPGNLGKLQTLSTGKTNVSGKTVSSSVISDSFGAIDAFNQQMGGKQNQSKVGRDYTYGTDAGSDKRSNTFTGATDPTNNADRQATITKEVKESGKRGVLKSQHIYSSGQGNGPELLQKGMTQNLIGMAKNAGVGSGQRGEAAFNELNKIVSRNTPKESNAGYESTFNQKYEYPTDVSYMKGGGESYSGPVKGKAYFSPASTMAQNIMASKAADARMNFSEYNAKRKANLGLK
jgi:hypothetical protein